MNELRFLAVSILVVSAASPAWSQTETYTDAQLGYTVSWPVEYVFTRDPELLGRVIEEVREEIADGAPRFDVGPQFFLFRYRPDEAPPFNPNVNLTIERIPAEAGEITTAQYAAASAGNLGRIIPGAQIVAEPTATRIDGRTFYLLEYEFTMGGYDLRSKVYMYYRPESRMAFSLTMIDVQARADEHFPELEEVVRSVRLD